MIIPESGSFPSPRVGHLAEALFSVLLAFAILVSSANLGWNLWFGQIALGNGSTIEMNTLPRSLLGITLVIYVARTAILVALLLIAKKVITSFNAGKFFEQSVIMDIHRLGVLIVGIALLDIVNVITLFAGLIGLKPLHDGTQIWQLASNIPFFVLVWGLFLLAIAAAFRRAKLLAEDVELTV